MTFIPIIFKALGILLIAAAVVIGLFESWLLISWIAGKICVKKSKVDKYGFDDTK